MRDTVTPAELLAAIPIPLRYTPNRDLDGLTPAQVVANGHIDFTPEHPGCPACRHAMENLAQ